MGKINLAQISMAALLLLASSASASLHEDGRTSATKSATQVADSQIAPPLQANAKLFSHVVLDPARCAYEYVEMHGKMIVRSELKLTCTTHY